jgi:hypothetical protein
MPTARLRVFLPCSEGALSESVARLSSDQEWGHSFARAPARSRAVRVAFSSHVEVHAACRFAPTMPFNDALRSSIEPPADKQSAAMRHIP